MLQAMIRAPVGDDVLEVDPTVDRLQRATAERLGKEAAIYMPSGSMTNQIAVRVHCDRGSEFLCEADCHIYNYEQAAFAQLSGIASHTIQGEFGVLNAEQFIGKVRGDGDHLVRTRLVTLENTHNRGGGRLQPYDEVVKICQWAHRSGLKTHLDGARLWNAAIASGIALDQWAAPFDTISVCFSKGLGAPIGSCLVGPRDFIHECRRHRKLFGGGMRQVGLIAAAALHAMDHHYDRLVEDHQNARWLAEAIGQMPHLTLHPPQVDTNIVIFAIDKQWGTAKAFVAAMEQHGVRALPFGPQLVRLITHLDVSQHDCRLAADAIGQVAAQAVGCG
jgi:threonine aldolase